MSQNGVAGPFVIGFIAGIIVLMTLVKYGDSIVSRHYKMIEECERSLPRDQHCKTIAVPVEKEEK